MSERTIYTCDQCGVEDEDREKFMGLSINRSLVLADYSNLHVDSRIYSGQVIMAKGLFCRSCCEKLFAIVWEDKKEPTIAPNRSPFQRLFEVMRGLKR